MAFADEVLKAEIQWATFICEKDLSPNLSDDASKLFASMFLDSKIASKFSCGRTKATYLISDESNKTHGKKYLNILVRNFNPSLQKPETKFYKTVEVHGKADDIVAAIDQSFKEDNVHNSPLKSMNIAFFALYQLDG